jgi:hypothetical protein
MRTVPTGPIRRHRAGLPLAVVLTAAVVAITGCSSDPGGSGTAAPPTHAPSPGAVKAAPGLPKGVNQVVKVPTQVPNEPQLRHDVAITVCDAAASGWHAAGTATNTGKKVRDYTITVFFTTKHATVIGTGRTKVSVDPGSRETWSITDDFTAPEGTQCVLRGVG